MDLKREAAREASTSIKKNTSIGLGDGATIRWLAGYLMDGIGNGINVSLYTSSIQTELFLQQSGARVLDISLVDELDIYFDGCDQVDIRLNALKSGAGIHTNEKLFAAMAKRFIILADASKFVSKLDKKFPLVLEVLPQAIGFVIGEMKRKFPATVLQIRVLETADKPILTRNGNLLVDCFFPEWPDLGFLNKESKKIKGVVEISLFYRMVNEAIIAGNSGIHRYVRKNGLVSLIDPT
jgi:ribose 5-phosphate isomerase A